MVRVGAGALRPLRTKCNPWQTEPGHRGAQWFSEYPSGGPGSCGRPARCFIMTAGASRPNHQPRVPCWCFSPSVLPAACPPHSRASQTLRSLIEPVPSGLFHAGHVPGERPCWRAGYVSPRGSSSDAAEALCFRRAQPSPAGQGPAVVSRCAA